MKITVFMTDSENQQLCLHEWQISGDSSMIVQELLRLFSIKINYIIAFLTCAGPPNRKPITQYLSLNTDLGSTAL